MGNSFRISIKQLPHSIVQLSEDMATLVNNSQGSDVEFRVGGSSTQGTAEIIIDEGTTATLYAHSAILRCRSRHLTSMLDEQEKSLRKIIYLPKISSSTFKDVLHYIYTGIIPVKTTKNIIELITAADELELEGLAMNCILYLEATLSHYFSDKDNKSSWLVPIDIAVGAYIIPTLKLVDSDTFFELSKHELFFELSKPQSFMDAMLPRMSVILNSPDAYTAFVNGITSEILATIISSDDLVMSERDVWNLVLDWACHQISLPKSAIEEYLRNSEGDKKQGPSTEAAISESQLKELKAVLKPHLSAIRFSLLDPDDYVYLVDILNYFLPRSESSKLTRYFLNPDIAAPLNTPRSGQKISSTILLHKPDMQKLLRKAIFKTGEIIECLSSENLKFELLFRASEHGFLASTFHQGCDNKGPTLVIVKSEDEHLFGGVNFSHWTSSKGWSASYSNFLFALTSNHQENLAVFNIERSKAEHSSHNHPNHGPTFGYGYDLYISNSANDNKDSYSSLPRSYEGIGASETTLAGSRKFKLSDYEVFAISKQ